MADLDSILRFVHVITASLWFGGAVFMLLMISPVVNKSGPAGKAFMIAVMRNGGLGKYFGPAAGLTVLLGLVMFYRFGYHDSPFSDAPSIMVTLGALMGILAFVEGLAVSLPAENKLKKIIKEIGPQGPTPAQLPQIEALAKKMSKAGMRGAVMIAIGFLLMAGRTLV